MKILLQNESKKAVFWLTLVYHWLWGYITRKFIKQDTAIRTILSSLLPTAECSNTAKPPTILWCKFGVLKPGGKSESVSSGIYCSLLKVAPRKEKKSSSKLEIRKYCYLLQIRVLMIKASHQKVEPHLYSNALYLLSWLFLQFVKFLLDFNPIIQSLLTLSILLLLVGCMGTWSPSSWLLMKML